MAAALEQARRGHALGEVPVGAVLMRGDELLVARHNETVRRHDPLAHAELLVLQQAWSDNMGRLADATLYITLEPCAQCAGAIVLARVGRVVFGAWDDKAGMAGSIHDLLRHPRLNHHAEVIGGVAEAECGELLRDFFRARRAAMLEAPDA
jgi:tRNA(adenine34) deaminase